MHNMLIIVCDQLSWFATGVAGNEDVRTPAMDRLAARGVCFEQAYCTSPVCVASRGSIWTGLLPHASGIYENSQAREPARHYPSGRDTLGSLFARHGYCCMHWGKTHDAGTLRGFECVPSGTLTGRTDPPGPPLYSGGRRDLDTVAAASAFLQAAHEKPFLAVADLEDPHDICYWLKDRSARPDLPTGWQGALPPLLPNTARADVAGRPLPVQRHFEEHVLAGVAEPWTDADYQRYLAAYYSYVARADRHVSTLLEALASGPHAATTTIVFLADHGESMGKLGHVSKGTTFYEETCRVPFLWAGAGIVEPGRRVRTELASLADLVPTLCGLAGITSPAGLDGIDLGQHLSNQAGDGEALRQSLMTEWREHAHHCQTGRMIRTARYKYMYYLRDGGEELYDLAEDPWELQNLARDPAQAATLERHRQILRERCAAAGDDFFSLKADSSRGLKQYWKQGRRLIPFAPKPQPS